jgi:RHS repeat-associated protein
VSSYTSTVSGASGTTENSYTYTYDVDGNITQIVDGNGKKISYKYDDLGQLLRENNQILGKTYVYTYDNGGNRKSKKTYAYTTANSLSSLTYTEETYTYGNETWGDQLTKVNSVAISYDAIGNPTTFNGYDLTWHGRQLKQMSRNGGQSLLKFMYNADGIRTNKIVNGSNHVYTLNGTQIVSEAWGNFLLIYLYDESGAPIGLQYRTKSYAANIFDTFYFEKNLQGDIIAVYNADGEKIGSYTYDAWGNCTVTVVSESTTLEKNIVRSYNPFRYRGYYYDTETQLYYLQSRYYNPAWGRFLNADGYVNANGDLIGFNMYAYCSNNPVMYVDPYGTCPQWLEELYNEAKEWVDENCVQPVKDAFRNYVKAIVTDINNFDENNEDIQTALDANFFSMYRGQLVIKSALLGETAASFGVIVLGSGANNERVLRHEWGHTQQLKEMGAFKYCYAIALPSFGHATMDLLKIYDIKNYYSLPWEYDADLRGGVIGQTYTSDVDDRHAAYFGAIQKIENTFKRAVTTRPYMPNGTSLR